MSHHAGWLTFLSDLQGRFETLSNYDVELSFYIAPDRPSFLARWPEGLREKIQQQIVLESGFIAGIVYPTFSYCCLFANPQPPNHEYLIHTVFPTRDQFVNLAKEAWELLPLHVRQLSAGQGGVVSWLLLVYRLLLPTGVAEVFHTSELSGISMDVAKASSLAIQELVRRESVPQTPPESNSDLTTADGPVQWAKLFGISASTFKRHCENGKIRHKKLSAKSYQVAIADLPAKHRAKFSNVGDTSAK